MLRSYREKYYEIRERFFQAKDEQKDMQLKWEGLVAELRKLRRDKRHLLNLLLEFEKVSKDCVPPEIPEVEFEFDQNEETLSSSQATLSDSSDANEYANIPLPKRRFRELYKQLEVARKRISELEEQPEGQKQQLLLIGNILTPISPPNSVETAKPSSPYSGEEIEQLESNVQKRTTSLRSDKSGEGGSNQFLNLLNADDLEASIETGKKRRRKIKRDDRTDAKPVELLPIDENGQAILPVTVGKGHDEVTIYSIGKIIWDREGYHTQRYIFPVGYRAERLYSSTLDAQQKVKYICEILDGGDSPIFRVIGEDRPDFAFTANSASGVWKKILDEIIKQGFGARTHASGPQLFGLSNLGVTKIIQEMTGAERCTKYVKQRWLGEPTEAERRWRHQKQYFANNGDPKAPGAPTMGGEFLFENNEGAEGDLKLKQSAESMEWNEQVIVGEEVEEEEEDEEDETWMDQFWSMELQQQQQQQQE